MAISRAPAKTVEGRENQLISIAIDLAEKQMLEGNAPPSVITHFLRLGSTNAKLEKAKLEHETALLRAKTENLYNINRVEEKINEALSAMKTYRGVMFDEEINEDMMEDDY